MSRSLTLVAAAFLALSSTPSLVLATDVVEADQSPAVVAPFQLNLARQFSSTVEQLKKRGAESKVSRAKERSISDELVALLKRTSPFTFSRSLGASRTDIVCSKRQS